MENLFNVETYTAKEVADIFMVNEEYIRQLLREKKLKSIKTSNKKGYVILKTDLFEYLEKHPKYHKRYVLYMTAHEKCVDLKEDRLVDPWVTLLERLYGNISYELYSEIIYRFELDQFLEDVLDILKNRIGEDKYKELGLDTI